MRYSFSGKAKTYVAVVILVFLGWTLFGQGWLSFRLGFFSRGYHVSGFRCGHVERRGVRVHEQNTTIGRILSSGGQVVEVDLDASISRGTLVLFAWRWPAVLYEEPMVGRYRFSEDAREQMRITLPAPGLYLLSMTALNLSGEVEVNWCFG